MAHRSSLYTHSNEYFGIGKTPVPQQSTALGGRYHTWETSALDSLKKRSDGGGPRVIASAEKVLAAKGRVGPRLKQQGINVNAIVLTGDFEMRSRTVDKVYPLVSKSDCVINKGDLVLSRAEVLQDETGCVPQRVLVGSANGLSEEELESLCCPAVHLFNAAEDGDQTASAQVNGARYIRNTGSETLKMGYPIYLDNPPKAPRADQIVRPAFVDKEIGGPVNTTKFLWCTRGIIPGTAGMILDRVDIDVMEAYSHLQSVDDGKRTCNNLRLFSERAWRDRCIRPTETHKCPVWRYWMYLTARIAGHCDEKEICQWFHGTDEMLLDNLLSCYTGCFISGELTQMRSGSTKSSTKDHASMVQSGTPLYARWLTERKLDGEPRSHPIESAWFMQFRSRMEAEITNWFRKRILGIALEDIPPQCEGAALIGQRGIH